MKMPNKTGNDMRPTQLIIFNTCSLISNEGIMKYPCAHLKPRIHSYRVVKFY